MNKGKQLITPFLTFFVISLFFGLGFETKAKQKNIPVKVQNLKKIKPSKTYFVGEVTPIKSAWLSTYNKGVLDYTATPGDYVFSEIKDTDGNVIRKGTPVIIQDDSKYKKALEKAKLNYKKAIKKLKLSKENFQRNKKLNKKNIVSEKQMQKSSFNYEKAKINKLQKKIAFNKAKKKLEKCVVYPEFSGQVSKVKYPSGKHVGAKSEIIKVTKMNPIFVKLNLPLKLINKLNLQQKIEVYSSDANKPATAILTKNPIDPSMAKLIVDNSLISSTDVCPDCKNLPKVNRIAFSIYTFLPKSITSMFYKHPKKFSDKSITGDAKIMKKLSKKYDAPLSVPNKAIKKDSKGHYVWRAKDQSILDKKNSISSKFKLEKVYIKPGNIKKQINYFYGTPGQFRSLKDRGSLNVGDVICIDVPNKIKEGDSVAYQPYRWRFTSGEKVAVYIKGLSKKGFYVPENAIFSKIFGKPEICIVKDGKAKFIKVEEVGYHDQYIRVKSPELKEGVKVVIEDNNTLRKIYDGANIKVIDTKQPPKKLEEDVAKPYYPVRDPRKDEKFPKELQ